MLWAGASNAKTSSLDLPDLFDAAPNAFLSAMR